jgi:membrane protease YdiL (CAAX protease family)
MKHKFGARTILIPILAVFGFYLIQFVVSAVYLFVYAFLESANNPNSDIFTEIIENSVNIINANSNYIFIMASTFVIIFAAILIALMSIKSKEVIWRKKVKLSVWIASVFIIIGTSGIISLQLAGIQALGEFFEPIKIALENYAEMANMFIASDNILLIIVSTCILVPIAEELIFRGIVQGELRRVMPGAVAVVIQALIFAVVHINPIQVSYVIIPALVLGAVYEWTKSIYVPIILHMIFNFTGAALPVILADNEKAYMFAVMVTIAMIPVGIFGMLYMITKRYKQPEMSSAHAVVQSASGYSDDSYQITPEFKSNINISENEDSSDYDNMYSSNQKQTNMEIEIDQTEDINKSGD